MPGSGGVHRPFVCVVAGGCDKVLLSTRLPRESQGSAPCLSFPIQKGRDRLPTGERLWAVLVELDPL